MPEGTRLLRDFDVAVRRKDVNRRSEVTTEVVWFRPFQALRTRSG
jgi:hypothetical protein